MAKSSLNKAQREAVEYTSGPLLIIAGAGTGKTTVITEKICHILEKKLAKPEEILALTFNDKAAAEIQERIDAMVDLGYSELTVSTFHAFCQRILERHAIDIGLSGQFKLLTKTASWLFMRKYLDKFNLDYYRPVGNPYKHIHELLRHFSKCKDELITPAEYLEYAQLLTLNTDAVPEKKLRNHEPGRFTASTKIKKLDETISKFPNFQISDFNRVVELANAYHTYNQLLLDNALLDFGDLIFYTNKLFTVRPHILAGYQKQFKYILVDEFQDVNWSQYALIQLLVGGSTVAPPPYQGGVGARAPGAVAVFGAAESHRVTRAQKTATSPALRSDLSLERRGSQPILTVVGDDDQSIYAFRGASVSNIMHFKDDFPEAKEVVLNENYRSNQEILDVAYKSIQNNNPDRLEVKLKIDKKLIAPIRTDRDPCATAEAKGGTRPATPVGAQDDRKTVVHIHTATVEDEVTETIKEIMRLKAMDDATTWDDFAILARANSHLDPFIEALETRGIPFEFLASSGLFRQSAVLDCLNFFKLLDNHSESTAVFRLLRLPFLKFKENDLHKFTQFGKRKSVSYYEALRRCREADLSEEGIAACGKIVEVLHAGMRQSRYDKPSVLLYAFLEKIGYLHYLVQEDEAQKGTASLVKQFFDVLGEFESVNPDAHVSNLLEHLTMIMESGDKGDLYTPGNTPDTVNLLTVHAAKGLEFKYVFIINCVEERFPTRSKGDGIEIPTPLIKEQLPEGESHYQEERRLFYVAATRAKERLYFTSASDYGGVRTKKLSRFLAELGYKVSDVKPAEIGIAEKRAPRVEPGELLYELPKKFSYSHIQMYETCPYKYKLSHVIKLPSKGSHYFSFGTTIHSTLQTFYERVQVLNSATQVSLFAVPLVKSNTGTATLTTIKVPTLEELLALYKEKWIPDWYLSQKQRESYFEKGRDLLTLFFTSQENSWTVPTFLETGFKVTIGDYVLDGKIDRIDQLPDGTLEIIDYKTGKAKTTLTSSSKEQLLIYQIAAEQLPQYRHIGKPSKLTFYYLEEGVRTSFIGDNKDLEKLRDTVSDVIDNIKARNFTATPSQFACEHCDFRDICDYRI